MKLLLYLGRILIGLAFLFVFVGLFVISSDGISRYDVLGLIVPEPPGWTTLIPYAGLVIGFFFEMLSLHGVVFGVIFFGLAYLGFAILMVEERTNKKDKHGSF